MKTTLCTSLVTLLLPLLTAHAAETAARDAKELAKLIKAAKPGDVIVMADGEWKDADIRFYGDGTESQRITLRAQTPGKVKLTGKSRLRIGGSWMVVDGLTFTDGGVESGSAVAFRGANDKGASNCRITNCAFIDYNPAEKPIEKQNTQWLSVYGTRNEVDRCYFKGKNNNGPMLVVWVESEPNNHHIHHNHFAGRPPLGENGGETMRIGTSDVSLNNSRTLVEHNYFEHCDGEAEVISSKSCENIYRYNTFVECKGALVLRHGNRNEVYGNWFFGNGVAGTGGIRLIGEDQKIYNNYLDGLAGKDFESAMPVVNGIPNSKPNEYFRVQRAFVGFNTLVNCTQNITFGIGAGARNRLEPPMDCTYANNMIVSKSGPLVKFQDQPINTTWIGNVLFGAESGIDSGEGVTAIDPKLVAASDRVSRPSQSIAAQGDFPLVTEDIEGRPRTSSKSAGCFEATGTATRRPLTANDVGPAWMRESR